MRRTARFKNGEEKARWLDSAASTDVGLAGVRPFARRFASLSSSPADFAERVYNFIRDNIKYRSDPGHKEEFADTATILFKTGRDDCDGKARAFVALIRAGGVEGIRARIRPVFDKRGNFTHVQAEVAWDGSKHDPRTQPNGWILAEMILRDCKLGQDPDTVRRVGGKRVLA